MHRFTLLLSTLALAASLACESAFQPFVLIDGQNPCTIVVDLSPYQDLDTALAAHGEFAEEKRAALVAAQELRHYLARLVSLSERSIRVIDDGQSATGRILLLGLPGEESAWRDAAARLKKLWLRSAAHSRGGIRIDAWRTEEQQIVALTCRQPADILDAAYSFLEQQGVVWFTPGDHGDRVPGRNQLSIQHAAVIKEPAMTWRGFFPGCPDQGGARPVPSEWLQWWQRQHVRQVPAAWLAGAAPLQSPGMQAVHSSRSRQLAGWQPGFCAADAAAMRSLQQSIWPLLTEARLFVLDGTQAVPLCTCPACEAMGNESTRLTAIFGYLGHELQERQKKGRCAPDCRLMGIVPPVAPDRLLPKEWPAQQVTLAVHLMPRCYNHAIGDAGCTEVNQPLRQVLQEWLKQSPNATIAVVEGYYAAEFSGLPLVLDHVLNSDMATYQSLGIQGVYCEAPSPAIPGMQHYLNFIFAQSTWNGRLSVDSLRSDYFSAYYPGLSTQVMEYFDMAEEALANISAWRYVLPQRVNQLQRDGFTGTLLPLPGFMEHFSVYEQFGQMNDGVDWERTFQLIHDMRHVMDDLLDANPPDPTFDRVLQLEKQLQFADLTITLYDNVIRTLTLGADEPEMREEAAMRLRQVVKKMTEFAVTEDSCGRTSALEQSGIAAACQALLDKLEQEYGVPYQRVYQE